MRKRSAIVFAALAISGFGADQSDTFYSVIRSNNLGHLETILKGGASPDTKDARGITPLMYAATVGSADAMRMLVEKGADVNAQNAFGSTALMWSVTDIQKVRLLVDHGANVNLASKAGHTALSLAAMSDGSSEIVRLLISKGADVKAVDEGKFTTLNAACIGNDTATIRMLIDAGVDVNAPGGPGLTPLFNAASNNNAAAVKMLLAKGADVNAVSADNIEFVKNGPIALGKYTALLGAEPYASAELTRTLLDGGADVNARDVRGLTALMMAVATDRENLDAIKLLLAKGAHVNVKSLAGETALDWARRSGRQSVVDLLAQHGAVESSRKPVSSAKFAPVDLKPAVERSIALMAKTSGEFFVNGGCSSCHHQNITDIAVSVARAHGIRVDEKGVTERQKLNRAFFGSSGPALLERIDKDGSPAVPIYALASMALSGYEPDRMTDALLANVLAQQWSDGRWFLPGARPPIQDGDIPWTALALRALTSYGPPGRAAEIKQRIGRAKSWLTAEAPITNQDRTMQLLGLYWAGADAKTLQGLAAKIVIGQNPDGGWAQRAGLGSDAYATGQTLFALLQAGTLSAKDGAYQKAQKYLLATQHADGSWFVASRAQGFQPYFESGFSYGHDQWISSMATGWATAALAYGLEPTAKAKTVE